MIVIDGRQSGLSLSNFANLEEVLTKLIEEEQLEDRIVTDVFVNEESFSELYPHQSEDIETEEIQKLELKTISFHEMSKEVVIELPKVIRLMALSGRELASHLRANQIAEGVEILQDIVSVTRDFINTISLLRSQYSGKSGFSLDDFGEKLGDILGEINEAIEFEDWMLVADLIEYEYLPECEGWRNIVDSLADDIGSFTEE